jgi:P-type Cu2+ transporter
MASGEIEVDVAIETDDVVLMLSGPLDVPTALAICRGTLRKISPEHGLVGRLQRDRATNRGRRVPAGFRADGTAGDRGHPHVAVILIVAVNALLLRRLGLP